MERTGRPSATAFQPLQSHINAAIQDPMTANGVHTPSYGGVVSTGVEWDYVVHPDGSRSRAPSRSPNRAAAAEKQQQQQQQGQQPVPMRSLSNPLDATTSDMLRQPLPPVPSLPAASSAHTFTAHPSTHPHEPTISEEASAYVGRSVSQSAAHSHSRQGPSSRNYPGSPQTQQGHKSPAAALAPVNASTGAPYAAAAPPASSSKRRQYRQVGDWVLQKTLGQGSMGKVKLGINVQTQEKCAVKIVPRHREDPSKDASGRSKDESKEIRTVREASISLLLHHPYICGMRDFLVHQNHYYMVFEYIDGGQMLDYIIAHGRLRERAARKFARQIASALDYCHHNNIVHRDLKIENILISNNGNIKIIDFGLSNLYSPHRHLSTFCGSLYFAAPELLNAKLYTGPEVDIWSFGIVLYVLVCGKVPFDDQSMPALHAKIKRGLAEYPAWLSNDCKALLQRMLNTNPQERATLQEVLNHPWMTKGYDGRPDSHLIMREPLRADELDMDIIKRMQGFTFGTPEEIHENLTKILTSEQYLRCVQVWEASRDRSRTGANGSSGGGTSISADSESPKKKRFSGFDLKRKIFKEEKKPEEGTPSVKEPLDPSSGFDPLISIYFLAREKKERSKVYGDSHFADSSTSVDPSSIQPIGYGAALPSLPAPPSAHGAGYEQGVQGSPRDTAPAVQRLRPEDMPSAAASQPQTHMADMPSAHHRRGHSQASPAMSPGAATVPSMVHPPVPDHEATRTSQDDGRSMNSMTNAMGRASLSGRDSQRTSGTPAQPITPPESLHAPLGIIQDKSGGIRPIGAPELDEVEAADVANMDLKSVYLKGLFSVSTTSTKSARTLLRDISHVLDRVGIKYRPIRGGFECIHVPSIDLASVVHGDEARSSLHVPPQPLESTPSKNKLALHKSDMTGSTSTSRGDSPSPAIPQGSSGTVGVLDVNVPSKSVRLDQDDGDAWGLQYGGQSPLAVRFEVFVVKVPWLPLHGIQFRRIGGDGWQYQQLAKTILREMRL